jgi:glycosyltransferase involved in cell wall biosynthesis
MFISQKTKQTLHSVLHYPMIVSRVKQASAPITFIFPTYQIGGGERVHADIMQLVRHLNPTCFITTIPVNDGFKKAFAESAKIIELKRWGSKKAFIPVMAKRVAKSINMQKEPIVFGCNADFLYALIPYLKPEVKVVDLTHAFTEYRNGMELTSLPYVDRIDERIVLGQKTLNDYRLWYKQHGIPEKHLNEFRIIPNKVSAPQTMPSKKPRSPLRIVFVSRNAPEKRPEMYFKIVEACVLEKLPVRFTIVGDFDEYREKFENHVVFAGEVRDKTRLDAIYNESHLILITSIIEGFPMVLLEGMARGVVPIATDVGEIPHFISEEQKTGFLIDQTLNNDALVKSFVNFIKKSIDNPELLTLFAETGHQLIRREFSPEKFRNSYLHVLTSPKRP